MPRFATEYRLGKTALQKARAQVRARMHGPEYPALHALLETPPVRLPPKEPGHLARLKREAGKMSGERTMMKEFYATYADSQKELTHLPMFGSRVTTVGMRFVERQLKFMERGMTEAEAFQACEHLYETEATKMEDAAAEREQTEEERERAERMAEADEWRAAREKREKELFWETEGDLGGDGGDGGDGKPFQW
jgi:hypothetical protein